MSEEEWGPGTAEREAMIALMKRFGLEEGRAEFAAEQLFKRARQLAAEKGCSEIEAMGHLLGLINRASQGDAGPDSADGRPGSSVGD